MTKRMTWGLSALAILALGLATCRGPQSKTTPERQAADESEVAAKGAFDADDAAASAPAEKTPAESEQARQQFSPYAAGSTRRTSTSATPTTTPPTRATPSWPATG